MPIPADLELYKKAKQIADETYKLPSAYKSGFIVKTYKAMGGTYIDDNKERDLSRWFLEKWININPNKKGYPVLRPTVRVNANTPKTVSEADPNAQKKQIKLKQKIKGTANLPVFV